MFSYSGRVKSPERRWQWRRADLRHFEIFRHGPIIIYTRLPAGGTYYPICTFPASSECLIGISDAFSAFCLRVSVIFPTSSLYPQQKRAYSALYPQAWPIYTGPCRRLLLGAVPWTSEDCLLHCFCCPFLLHWQQQGHHRDHKVLWERRCMIIIPHTAYFDLTFPLWFFFHSKSKQRLFFHSKYSLHVISHRLAKIVIYLFII